MTRGERIREKRREHNLSQYDLADLVGVSQSAIALWERDQTMISPGNLQCLADALDTTPAYITLGVEEKKPVIEVRAVPKPTVDGMITPPVEKVIIEEKKPVCYNVKDKEDLRTIDLLIRHIPDLKVARTEQRAIYTMISEIRTKKEADVLFGKEE